MKQTSLKLNLKPKQTEILTLLYRFRFLTRPQIQKIFKHKHHSRILNWLNDLTQKQCINQSYDKKFISNPAIYSLAPLGRKYLKSIPEIKQTLLSRVWRESKYSIQFQNHHLFLADIYLSLLTLTTKSKAKLHFHTKTDLSGMDHLIKPSPDAYFAIVEPDSNVKRYFLDIFDDLPPTVFRKRVRQYFRYYASDEWQDNTDKPFPEIILICPSTRIKNHLFYYIQKKLSREPNMNIYLTTKESILANGLNRQTLEKIEPKD